MLVPYEAVAVCKGVCVLGYYSFCLENGEGVGGNGFHRKDKGRQDVLREESLQSEARVT